MPKINLVKAIVRCMPIGYRWDSTQNFIHQAVRYLLLQKAEDKYFQKNVGKWECVGGVIKPGETSLQTITREMEEETGFKPGSGFRIVRQFPTLESEERVCDVYLIEKINFRGSNNVRINKKEHSDYQWIKAEDAKKQDWVLYADLLLEFFNNPEKYLV